MSGIPPAGRYHLNGLILPDGAERDVWIVDGRFAFDRVDDAVSLATDAVLLPGMVDAHAHLALYSPAPPSAAPRDAILASGAAHLAAGVLAVREPGSPNRLSAGLGPEDAMPRIQSAGHLLSPPGTYIPGLARPAPDDALPDIVEEEALASRAWVKIIGDFPGADGRMARHYQPGTLVAATHRAHRAGARVAIHANLPEVIEAAIEAGIDSIEHGTMVDESHLQAMAKRHVALVPTLLIRDGVLGILGRFGLPELEIRAFEAVLDRQPAIVRRATELGVTVLAGTDAGMGPHGKIRVEIEQLLAAGVASELAVGAGSWTARAFLGLPGIEDGAPADVVAFASDPRKDPGVLGEPSVIVLAGRVLRGAASR